MQFQCNEMELIDWICFVLEPVNLCYREPCARCAGLRPADTATTGPTPASPAGPSSGGEPQSWTCSQLEIGNLLLGPIMSWRRCGDIPLSPLSLLF